jgi:hypothetical protein
MESSVGVNTQRRGYLEGAMILSLTILFQGGLSGLFPLYALATYQFTLQDFGVISFIVIGFLKIFYFGERISIKANEQIVLFVLIFLCVVLSSSKPLLSGNSGYILQYLKSSFHWFYLAVILLLLWVIPIAPTTWLKIIKGWLVASIFVNLFGIYQLPARIYDLPFAMLSFSNLGLGIAENKENMQIVLQFENFYRATSIFSEPSSLAAYNSLTLVLLLIPSIVCRYRFFKSNVIHFSVLFLALIGLFLTFSLTGVIQVVFILSGTLLILPREKIVRFVRNIILISVPLLLVADVVVEKYTNTSLIFLYQKRIGGIFGLKVGGNKEGTLGESLYARSLAIEGAYNVWINNPTLGIGIGCARYSKIVDVDSIVFTTSTPFQLLCDMGTHSVFIFYLFLGSMVVRGAFFIRKTIDKNTNIFKPEIILGTLSCFLSILIISFSTGGIIFIDITTWVFMGMICSIQQSDYFQLTSKEDLRFNFVASTLSIQKILLQQGKTT